MGFKKKGLSAFLPLSAGQVTAHVQNQEDTNGEEGEVERKKINNV